MSAQSGIRVSEQLAKDFTELTNENSTKRALKVSIIQESLQSNGEVERKSSEKDDFGLIEALVAQDAACYVIFLLDDGKCLLISYVEDTAKVRDKMLYASTRSTLTRDLGSGQFAASMFATSKEDLTCASYETIGSSEGGANVLTEREQDIKHMDRAETDGTGTARTKPLVGGVLGMPLSEAASRSLKSMQASSEGSALAVILYIDTEQEVVDLDKETRVEASEICALLPKDSPRYVFYRDNADLLYFVYICPGTSKVKERMLYSSNKASVIMMAQSEEYGLRVQHKAETSDPQDLDQQFFQQQSASATPQTSSSTRKFAKPAKPRRPVT